MICKTSKSDSKARFTCGCGDFICFNCADKESITYDNCGKYFGHDHAVYGSNFGESAIGLLLKSEERARKLVDQALLDVPKKPIGSAQYYIFNDAVLQDLKPKLKLSNITYPDFVLAQYKPRVIKEKRKKFNMPRICDFYTNILVEADRPSELIMKSNDAIIKVIPYQEGKNVIPFLLPTSAYPYSMTTLETKDPEGAVINFDTFTWMETSKYLITYLFTSHKWVYPDLGLLSCEGCLVSEASLE